MTEITVRVRAKTPEDELKIAEWLVKQWEELQYKGGLIWPEMPETNTEGATVEFDINQWREQPEEER